MNTTHGSDGRVAFVHEPSLIKARKVASNSDRAAAIGMDDVRPQNASWVRGHSIDNAIQGIQVDLGVHDFSNGYTE